MKPIDPRLVHEVAPARRYVLLTAAVGVGVGVLVVSQAFLLADVIAATFSGAPASAALRDLALLGAVVLGRVVLAWVQERYGDRAATAVVSDLRQRVLAHAVALGPAFLASGRRAAVTTLVGPGLESLRPYLARYLPQLLLTAVLTPALLLVVAVNDPLSGLLIALTLPLVPLFMALVGAMTQTTSARRLQTMQRLGAQVLDLLAGLPTLVALGREQGPAVRLRALGEAHRRATNQTLRVAFLSTMVLELLTTLSVALVAVGVGLRLLSGSLDLRTALVVLVLAPEVYLPLRQVGTQFHASTDGLAAVDQAFGILHRPLPVPGEVAAPDLRTATIALRGVSVLHEGRTDPAPACADLVLRPGTVTVLAGPSGSGKSTVAEVVLGLRRADTGTAEVVDELGHRTPLPDLEPRSWLDQVVWLGQHAVTVPGTVRENALLFGTDRAGDLDAAARLCGLQAVVDELPDGWDTRVGDGGLGLSAGQRQRLALVRALLGGAPLVVLDEPGAHLDDTTGSVVLDVVQGLREARRTVLVLTHGAALAAVADEVVTLAPCGGPDEASDAGAALLLVATP